jgi:RNA polymerase sigma-70 factor (ECF subfamily)
VTRTYKTSSGMAEPRPRTRRWGEVAPDRSEDRTNGREATGTATTLLPSVYRELRRLAAVYLKKEGPYHTLQPTALVHEAYLRLKKLDRNVWRSKTHFFAIAAAEMRRVLVDHARAAHAKKRGSGARRVELTEDIAWTRGGVIEVLALDEALTRLATIDARRARVAELRLFTGMTVDETAEALDVSAHTVKGDWRVARVWIARELTRMDKA